jgi:hypothetical protein
VESHAVDQLLRESSQATSKYFRVINRLYGSRKTAHRILLQSLVIATLLLQQNVLKSQHSRKESLFTGSKRKAKNAVMGGFYAAAYGTARVKFFCLAKGTERGFKSAA